MSFRVVSLSVAIWERGEFCCPEESVVKADHGRIPFNLWRANHWYNKPSKKKTRPSKEDYSYYFKHNVSITTSGDFSTEGLKFCVKELGADRCLYSIGKPPLSWCFALH